MTHPFPDFPISVHEIQAYLFRNPIDCTLDSRELMLAVEEHFGFKVQLAKLVLACLWQGYAIIPVDRRNSFKFCKLEK